MIEVDYNEKTGRFLLTVPFDKNGLIRDMPGRRWMKRIKKWTVPAVNNNINILEDIREITWSDEAKRAKERVKEMRPKPSSFLFPSYYRFKTKPYKKQKEAIDAGYGRKEFAYFMGMGTGKTKVVIDTVSALWLESKVSQVLVICPVSIQSNWGEEIAKHSPIDAEVHVYRPQQHKKYEKWLLNTDSSKIRWLIVGTESLSAGKAADTAYKYALCGRTYSAVDESSRIKNIDAKRTEQAIKIGKASSYRSIMTGTPITQGPLDLFSQFEFLNTHIFGIGDYYSFRNRYAIMGGFENREVIGYDHLDEMAEIVQPFVYEASLKDMVDLPPKIYQVRHVTASKEQRELLKDIANGHAQVDDVEIEVKNVLEKLLRMQQVVNGFYTEYIKDPLSGKKKAIQHNLKTNPKIKELEALLDENSYQAILWGKYHCDMANIRDLVHSRKESYVEFHGNIPPEERQQAVNNFQDGVRYFVGNPAAGGMGITLTAARLMVYFSNSFSLEERLQSEDRAHRIGQDHPVTYVDLVMKGTVDELAQEALKNKEDMATLVLRKIREGTSRGLLDTLTGTAA